jgi:hypothetical protein
VRNPSIWFLLMLLMEKQISYCLRELVNGLCTRHRDGRDRRDQGDTMMATHRILALLILLVSPLPMPSS